jgi:transposase InsO family protein
MSVHSAVVEFRKRLVSVIEASPNRRVACGEAGIHPSTFYRWRNRSESFVPYSGLSMVDRMVEQQIVAKTLAFPALGPRPLADLLGDDGVMVSASKVWRTLQKHRLNTRQLRYALLRQHSEPVGFVEIVARPQRFIGVLDAVLPGDLVQMDCFHVGSFKETRLKAGKTEKGQIWQYTAIDVASSWLWAELHATTANPTPALTSALAHRVAADLTNWGWTPTAISTDNGNEYRAQLFRDTLEGLGIKHRFIRAGRPQSNGKVERVQRTILEECYQPTLIGYVEPSITGLRRDLNTYIDHYNWKRRHYGKWNNSKTPAQIMITPKHGLTP